MTASEAGSPLRCGRRIDARAQSTDELHQRRRRVVRMHQDGVPVMQIVQQSGLSWSAVNTAIKRFKEGGDAALAPAARGRKSGTGRKLSSEQEVEIRRCLRLRPRQCSLGDFLWSRALVARLIQEKFDVQLTDRAVGDYLDRWGVAPATSGTRPVDRCTPKVREWLAEHYPTIAQRVREDNEDGAEIYWLNRARELDAALWSSPLAEGAEPEQWSAVSVTNNQGKLLWFVARGSFTLTVQIMLVKGLLADRKGRRIHLIRNDLKVLCSDAFASWAHSVDGRLVLYPPPPTYEPTSAPPKRSAAAHEDDYSDHYDDW